MPSRLLFFFFSCTSTPFVFPTTRSVWPLHCFLILYTFLVLPQTLSTHTLSSVCCDEAAKPSLGVRQARPFLMGFLTDLEETEAQELQRKLEILNHIMDQETRGAPGNTRNPQLNLMCECVTEGAERE